MNRMRPQELFETFADMELAWGPTWSSSLKSLWLGEGEAIGDIAVGEELAEHLGTEPMHPVLMDLCTGVAFPAFPATPGGRTGVSRSVPAAAVRAGARCGRRCRGGSTAARGGTPARSTAKPRSSTSISSTGMAAALGGIREFTVKRAPREALLRGLGGDATRLLYTLGWHEVPPPPAMPRSAETANGTWLIAGFDELAAERAGLHPVRPDAPIRSPGSSCSRRPHERGVPFTGIVWRSAGTEPRDGVERRISPRGSRPRSPTCSAPCTPCRREGGETARRTVDRHRAGRGHRIRRAGRPGAGRAVGIRAHHRSTRSRRCAAGWSTATDPRRRVHSLAGLLGTPVDEPELALRQGQAAWPPGCCRGRAAVTSRCRAATTTSWRPPSAARSTTCA